MLGVLSRGRLGNLCHNSSVRKGIKGWIMVSALSSAVYKVCRADSCSSGEPDVRIAFEFSM